MGSNRTFAYNDGASIGGTEQIGYIAVGIDGSKIYNGELWWPGPDEDSGYIICHTSSVAKTAGGGTIAVAAPTIGFWRSYEKRRVSFNALCNRLFPGNGFTTGYDAAEYLGGNGYWTSYPPISNTDASEYYFNVIAAGGVVGYNQAAALSKLFDELQATELESGGGVYLYDVLEGFYPMLGISAAAQAINAKGNASYDLQLYGGWTFSYLGMEGNGVNTYAYTGKNYGISSNEELWYTHFSIYGTKTGNSPSNSADLSTFNGSNYPSVTIALNSYQASGDAIYEYVFNTYSGQPGNSGNFITMANDSNTTKWVQNSGYNTGSTTQTPYNYSYEGLYLGVSTSAGYSGPTATANRYGWASFGGFMSYTDMVNYQTIVNAFMTSIGRNTY